MHSDSDRKSVFGHRGNMMRLGFFEDHKNSCRHNIAVLKILVQQYFFRIILDLNALEYSHSQSDI